MIEINSLEIVKHAKYRIPEQEYNVLLNDLHLQNKTLDNLMSFLGYSKTDWYYRKNNGFKEYEIERINSYLEIITIN